MSSYDGACVLRLVSSFVHAVLNHRLDSVELSFFFLFVGFLLTFLLFGPCVSGTWGVRTASPGQQPLNRFDSLLVSDQIVDQ